MEGEGKKRAEEGREICIYETLDRDIMELKRGGAAINFPANSACSPSPRTRACARVYAKRIENTTDLILARRCVPGFLLRFKSRPPE